jgi:hypothetical protein
VEICLKTSKKEDVAKSREEIQGNDVKKIKYRPSVKEEQCAAIQRCRRQEYIILPLLLRLLWLQYSRRVYTGSLCDFSLSLQQTSQLSEQSLVHFIYFLPPGSVQKK